MHIRIRILVPSLVKNDQIFKLGAYLKQLVFTYISDANAGNGCFLAYLGHQNDKWNSDPPPSTDQQVNCHYHTLSPLPMSVGCLLTAPLSYFGSTVLSETNNIRIGLLLPLSSLPTVPVRNFQCCRSGSMGIRIRISLKCLTRIRIH
jgi:hypothetical protein